ncbi:MAG: hypothetical protein K6L75_03895 [Cellvibrionaceae bacterium]
MKDSFKERSINQDVLESLRAIEPLEDEIYFEMDKLEALCHMCTIVENSGDSPPPKTRSHYAYVVEDQIKLIRNLLNKLFD